MDILKSNNFSLAFDHLVEVEGGFSNIAQDHGGATKLGISLRFLELLPLDEADLNGDGHVSIDDIHALTEHDARDFYRRHFWQHYRLDRLLVHRPAVKLFGMLVNMRGRVAGRAAQRALHACGHFVAVDGLIGPKTLRAINSAEPRVYLAALRAEQAGVYRRIVERDPEQAVFIGGWLHRAYRTLV